MKKVTIYVAALLLLSGCFETKFNFRTVIHRNGKTEREVRIDGRGANRFLAPTGPKWEVKTYQTKGGQAILDDRNFHIQAQGRFANPNQVTSDFRYDVKGLVDNITDETKKEFQTQLGIPEPFDKEIRAMNSIQYSTRRKLLYTDHEYTEIFQNRWLIPILLLDLKKEIIRQEAIALKTQQELADSKQGKTKGTLLSPAILSPDKVEEMAQKKLTEEILPQFQFHSEVVLPGKIKSTNAKIQKGNEAIWDFRGTDFQKNFSVYVLRATSRSVNYESIAGLGILILLAIILIASMLNRNKTPVSRRRKE